MAGKRAIALLVWFTYLIRIVGEEREATEIQKQGIHSHLSVFSFLDNKMMRILDEFISSRAFFCSCFFKSLQLLKSLRRL